MSNDITNINHNTMTEQDRKDLARAYQEDGEAEQEGGLPLLKLTKGEGVWEGNGAPIEGNKIVLFNMFRYHRGWVHFEGGGKTDEIWVKPGEPRPDESSLTEHGPYETEGEGWKRAASVGVRDTETGEEFIYSPTSQGGRHALGGLAKQFAYRLAQNSNTCIPKVQLSSEWYPHKQYGKTWKPIFRVLGWVTITGSDGDKAAAPVPEHVAAGDPGPDGADEVAFTL